MDATEQFYRMLLCGKNDISESRLKCYAESIGFSMQKPLTVIYLVPETENYDLSVIIATTGELEKYLKSNAEANPAVSVCFCDENNCIYLVAPSDDAFPEHYCTRLAVELEQKFGFSAFFGIGKAAESYQMLSESATLAREMSRYRYNSKRKFASYSQITVFNNNGICTTDKYDNVITAFSLGNITKMSIALDELAEIVRKQPSISKMSIKRSMIEVAVRILNIASFSGVDIDKIMGSVDPYSYILSLQRTEEIISWILDLSTRLLDCVKQSEYSSENIAVNKAIAYIDANLSDPDLSLKGICEYVGLSNAYFSQLFKNSIGLGVNEYITNNRLLAAKKMLFEGNRKVEDVAYASGFSSYGYFTSVFRKKVGVTPGKYKSSIRR